MLDLFTRCFIGLCLLLQCSGLAFVALMICAARWPARFTWLVQDAPEGME